MLALPVLEMLAVSLPFSSVISSRCQLRLYTLSTNTKTAVVVIKDYIYFCIYITIQVKTKKYSKL